MTWTSKETHAAEADADVELHVAKELLGKVVSSGASRQVAAAVASALWRLATPSPQVPTTSASGMTVQHLAEHEEILLAVKEELGYSCGIGETCKMLRLGGFCDIASGVSNQHRCRKMVAHPLPG